VKVPTTAHPTSMLRGMTETPGHQTDAGPDEHHRWHERHRRDRIFRVAALVVTLAALVFIVAVIFWSGFILGACSGGHHGHGGGGSHDSGMMHQGPPQGQLGGGPFVFLGPGPFNGPGGQPPGPPRP
jgi:hypothetical protein